MKKPGLALLPFIAIILSISLAACSPVIRSQSQPAPVEPTRAYPTEVKPYHPDPAQSGSTLPDATAAPIPTSVTDGESVQPVLFGLWMKEHDSQRDLLTFTESSVYLVEAGTGSLRESFYEIQSVDWVNGVLDLQLKWVRVNGSSGGFDSPSKLMKVSIDGDTLFFSTVDAGMDLTSTTENGPWVRQ